MTGNWRIAILVGLWAVASCAGTRLRGVTVGTDGASAQVQLVQSVPQDSELAHPELPHTGAVWLRLIREARVSIDLAQYYIASLPGQALEPVLDELAAAAQRGVRLRVLLARPLIASYPDAYERLRALPNTTVRIYDLGPLTGGVLHAKYWIIDAESESPAQRQAFVGSQNLDWRSLTQIHELGVLLHDPGIISQLAAIFAADWRFAETGHYAGANPTLSPPDRTPPIELVASPEALNPPGIRAALPTLIALLQAARSSIRIQLLDYSPFYETSKRWEELDAALRQAAARGVRIELLVSPWNAVEPALSHLKALSQLPNFDVRIATIPQLASGFIPHARVVHSKYMLVDDRILWLGTSNWARRYFYASRNIELVLRDAQPVRQAREVFTTLWTSRFSERIDPAKTYPPPRRAQ